MPESETGLIDYFPEGWEEEIHDEYYIEWIYQNDDSIFVRVDGTAGPDMWVVEPITGINQEGEQFVTRPLSDLSKENAFEVAQTLIYALNGAIGRIQGEPEFSGDK